MQQNRVRFKKNTCSALIIMSFHYKRNKNGPMFKNNYKIFF